MKQASITINRFFTILLDSENFELILLYLPLLFLLFPQKSEYFFVKTIFWAFPFLYYWVIISRPRRMSPRFITYCLLWTAFFVSVILSTLNSADRGMSIIKLADYLAVFLYSTYFYFVVDTPKKIQLFLQLLIFTGLILVALSVYFQLIQPQTIGGINLFYPTHGHNQIVSFMFIVLPITIVKTLTSKPKKARILYFILSAIFYFQFLLSFSRAAYLIFPLIIFLILFRLKPSIKQTLTLITLLIFPLLIFLSTVIATRTITNANSSLSLQTQSHWLLRQTIKPFFANRLPYWQQALDAFTEYPVLGYGPGTFPLISYKFRSQIENYSLFAHNQLLQILAEQGIVGVTTVFLIFLFVISRLTSTLNISPTAIQDRYSSISFCLSIGIIATITLSLFDFTFEFHLIATLFWSIITILIHPHPLNNFSLNHHINPIFLPTCLLFILSGFYCSSRLFVYLDNHNQLSLSQPDSHHLLTAINLFPFDPNLIVDYLKSTSLNSPSQDITNLPTNTFHHQNPQTLLFFARHYIKSNPVLAKKYFLAYFHLDPLTSKYDADIPSLLIRTHDFSSLLDLYGDELLTTISKSQLEQFNSTLKSLPPTIISEHSLNHLSLIAQREIRSTKTPPNYLLAQIFYGLGLDYMDLNRPDITISLWYMAAAISPKQAIYQLELAELYSHFNRPDLAANALSWCLEERSDPQKIGCGYYLEKIANHQQLLPPGNFSNQILNEYEPSE